MSLTGGFEETIVRKVHTLCLIIVLCLGVLIAPTGIAAQMYDVTASEIFNPLGIVPGVPLLGEFVKRLLSKDRQRLVSLPQACLPLLTNMRFPR